MHKIIQLLKPIIKFNIRYPVWVVTIATLSAIVATYFAVQLTIDPDIANLLPENHSNVQALNRLQAQIGGETEMQVAIKSPSFEANVAFAERLAEESLKLHYPRHDFRYFNRAEFYRDTEILQDNALYLATESELQDIIHFLESEIDKAREEANPFFIDFGDEFEDDEVEETMDIERFRESYDNLIPSEYPVSADSTLAILSLYPTGSQNDLQYLRDMFEEFDGLIEELNPAEFHPDMEVQFGGRLKRHLNEFESIMNDVFNSFAYGFSSVILLVMLYFWFKQLNMYQKGGEELKKHSIWSHLIRMPVPVMVIGIPLLISLAWTFGLTYFQLGVLNTMTSVLFVILFGLSIDYGLHYYARYIELRSDGQSIERAVIESYVKTGSAIFVSAATTASALFVLTIADFRGFSEFGYIAGVGVTFALLCMLFVMPALLVLFDRGKWLLLIKRSEEYAEVREARRFPFAGLIIGAGLLVTTLFIFPLSDLQFEYEFNELEPVFEEYEEFRAFSSGVDESTLRNPAYILADTDEEVFEILDIVRERQQSNPETMIYQVEALQERFPPNEELANQKLEYISQIRELLDHSFIRGQENESLDILRRGSQTTEPLDEDLIPDFLKNRFTDRQGNIGKFVIVYPDRGLSDGRNSIAFKNELSNIRTSDGKEFFAASTSIVAASMLEVMQEESPYMIAATFIIVFLFILFSFGNLWWSLIALIPLIVGLIWLFAFMAIFDFKVNFYNMVVLPAILGIACDNGVHLAHRFRDEGKFHMRTVLRSTGQHITIGSLTTMLGFVGLLFTTHPGLRSIGIMAILGMGMTWFIAILLLPAIVQKLEDKNVIHD